MNKRFFLALGISLVFYLLWIQLGLYFGIVEPEQPEPPVETAEQVDPASAPEQALNATETPSDPPQEPPAVEQPPQETIERVQATLENDHIRIELDNRGGLVRAATLQDYYLSAEGQQPVELVSSTRHFPGEVVLENGVSTKERMFKMEREDENRVTFRLTDANLQVTKTFTLEDGYGLRCEISVEENGAARPFYMVVSDGLQPVKAGDRLTPSFWDLGAINPKVMNLAWSEDGDHETKGLGDLTTGSFDPLLKKENWIEWAGVKDTYFANIFLLDEPMRNAYVKGTEKFIPGRQDAWMLPVLALRGEGNFAGRFFMGPIEEETLRAFDPAVDNLISYGWAGLLSKWLFILLKVFHDFTGNWGWSIVILTLLLRVALVPMMVPSIKSSLKMRKIQPKIEKLRQKFSGSDLETKQKLSQETFKLYKEEGVNPFSSCITALAQMPIFIAYFSLLRSSISLRQAEWMFWIEDLSIKDPTYVLPIVMGVTMFLSTAAMPMPSTDPAQQKMMKVMPVLFSLMFIGMPAGLILYMIASNIFSLGQTYFMKWRLDKQ